jgi:large subunit ribosomal protein L23
MIDLVKYPVITEKSYRLIENQYTFDVDPRLTKTQIKKSFRKFFQRSVNTHLPPVEKKRLEDRWL